MASCSPNTQAASVGADRRTFLHHLGLNLAAGSLAVGAVPSLLMAVVKE